jgi:transcriptional antiterminator NusG
VTVNIGVPRPQQVPLIHPVSPYPWYAVKVRTGAELRIAASLSQKNISVFTPTCVEPRKYSDRIKNKEVALFPGYVFSRFDADYLLPLVTTPGVEFVVSTAGVPAPIDPSEMEVIIHALSSGVTAEPWPYLKSGDKVQINFGSLAGVEGILINARGKDRLILSVHLLQRSISVDISRNWVRPA